MTLVPMIKSVLPYFEIATTEAKKSPCIRRRFGTVIVTYGPDIEFTAAHNERVGKCCGGNVCARTRLALNNGERTEVGAEIHAETAALIKHGPRNGRDGFVICAGVDAHNQPLYGKIVYPCHACAMAIKFAGFRQIYTLAGPDSIMVTSINQVLIDREAEWDVID